MVWKGIGMKGKSPREGGNDKSEGGRGGGGELVGRDEPRGNRRHSESINLQFILSLANVIATPSSALNGH